MKHSRVIQWFRKHKIPIWNKLTQNWPSFWAYFFMDIVMMTTTNRRASFPLKRREANRELFCREINSTEKVCKDFWTCHCEMKKMLVHAIAIVFFLFLNILCFSSSAQQQTGKNIYRILLVDIKMVDEA